MSSAPERPSDQFEPWASLPNVNERFDLQELRADADGLFVTLLSESERALRIDVTSPIAHRSSLRELNGAFWTQFEQQAGGVFWQVKDSSWSRMVCVDSELDSSQVLHYLVLTSEDVVEFLTDQVPHISWLDNFFGDAV